MTGKKTGSSAAAGDAKSGVLFHGSVRNVIAGTAGHVDHGKTTLIKALTGIDADRLAEEKRRGITIDLGFAHLQLTPQIRIGFVDVPGHERFVRNMLAGVGGIDLVFLVVAADESIKPQTREHFEICRLLGIQRGIVVITKTDAVESELVDLVRLELEELVAGSFLDGAPVVAVSALSGAGLPELRSCLQSAAAAVPPRDISKPARLPIDRAFTLRGFGTVVTGTLLSGTIALGQEIELLPDGRSLRVRGLQTYGESAEHAEGGTRTAVNIPEMECHEIERGMVLAETDRFETTRVVDCRLELLGGSPPLRTGSPVHFHSGTSAIEARVRLFGKDTLWPGESSIARLRFRELAVLARSDRFIVRRFSPVETIGGGEVIDTAPPRERRLTRIEERLRVLAGTDAAAQVELLVSENAFGMTAASLAKRLNRTPEHAVALARQAKLMVIDPPGWLVTRAWIESERARLVAAVQSHHRQYQLAAGIGKHELKAQIFPAEPPFLFDALLSGIPELTSDRDMVRHRAHRVTMNDDEQKARERIAAAFAQAGLTAPSVNEVLAQTGLDTARSQTLLRMLLKEGLLIRVSDELVFHREAIADLKRLLISRKDESFTVSAFKEWTGISRKYAVPLLEYLDREHVTIRKGDLRVVSQKH